MADERRAPVQGERLTGFPGLPPGTIAWSEHEEAFAVYAQRIGHRQSAERIAERGGFGMFELVCLLGRLPTTWEVRRG